MKKIIISLLLFSVNSAWASKKNFVCTPADAGTQITYGGKLFSVSVDSTCIRLLNLEDKTKDWWSYENDEEEKKREKNIFLWNAFL